MPGKNDARAAESRWTSGGLATDVASVLVLAFALLVLAVVALEAAYVLDAPAYYHPRALLRWRTTAATAAIVPILGWFVLRRAVLGVRRLPRAAIAMAVAAAVSTLLGGWAGATIPLAGDPRLRAALAGEGIEVLGSWHGAESFTGSREAVNDTELVAVALSNDGDRRRQFDDLVAERLRVAGWQVDKASESGPVYAVTPDGDHGELTASEEWLPYELRDWERRLNPDLVVYVYPDPCPPEKESCG